jgi:cytidylate kinase
VVIAIDGPSGVGKSTVARAVADALGLPYLDTGAYYRMGTLVTLRAGGDPASADDVLRALADADVDFVDGRLVLDGADVNADLRGDAVTAAVSAASAHRPVRRVIVDMQRDWVERHGGVAVVEGRDIGTVVFPDAAVKVFLTAAPETRARRRAQDTESSGRAIEEIAAEMMARDAADSTREASPLRPADDAVVIDTTELSVPDVVRKVLDLVGAP